MIRFVFLFPTFFLSTPLASRSCCSTGCGDIPPEDRDETERNTQKQKSKGVSAALVQGYHIPRRNNTVISHPKVYGRSVRSDIVGEKGKMEGRVCVCVCDT